jgi:regulator of protease activity HflC (stomatin/prohibitin superfamily)
MTNLVDKFFEVLKECFFFFVPFVVLRHYERGVKLRKGINRGKLEPGFHWVIPFNIDHVLHDNVAPRTHRIVSNLTTLDGRSVVVGLVVTSRIRDIEKALLEVEDMDTAMDDSCRGSLFRYVSARTWDDLRVAQVPTPDDDDVGPEELYKACRRMAFRWGVEVMRVQLSDLSVSRSLRLHMDAPPLRPAHAE